MFYFYRQDLLKDLVTAIKGMMEFQKSFEIWLKESGLAITDAQFKKLSQYAELLKKKNEELNLTSITSVPEVWIKHILDSLRAVPFFPIKPGTKVIDVGTGGGLPGIPLAILFPSVQFTLIDSTQKKIEAVKEFAHELNLKNVKCIAERAETLGHEAEHRDEYDIVLTRAVAPLKILAEYTVPLVCLYGRVIAYKGPEYITELIEARNAITKLQCEQPKVFHYVLPQDMGNRTIIQITKKRMTPNVYPRREGMPAKRPL